VADTRVLVVRGHQATPWNLRTWEHLPTRFAVSLLVTRLNRFDISHVGVPRALARSRLALLMPRRVGDLGGRLNFDRYVGIDGELAATDIVHTEELSYWFAAEMARRKQAHSYRLVVTVWETLPLLDAFRNAAARRHRNTVLAEADLFVAATERAHSSLLLEGVPPERIEVSSPGIELERFQAAATPDPPPDEHVLVSPGRLVWEKGHQDVIRAVAALRTGIVETGATLRLLIVGEGPERRRLEAYSRELGVADAVEFLALPYEGMPDLYARASCMVLASLASASCSRFLGDLPRCFWEEQFGLVLAEAMAAGLSIVASESGAIPEVAGDSATYFAPGDWLGLARQLAAGPLRRSPAHRFTHDHELLRQYSTAAAADRLVASYDRLLASARS
jgi:glycosyltransferase involved in cell wall biosynthesis